MWIQRQRITNSTFADDYDIGKGVSEWTRNYNKNNGKAIINILQEVTIDVFT